MAFLAQTLWLTGLFLWHEDAQKIRPAYKDLPRVRTAFCMAQKMGELLGRGEVLQRPVPE